MKNKRAVLVKTALFTCLSCYFLFIFLNSETISCPVKKENRRLPKLSKITISISKTNSILETIFCPFLIIIPSYLSWHLDPPYL